MNAHLKDPLVSIIVLNFNTKKITADCVASILEHRPQTPFEILVVDNASTDGSVSYLPKKFGRKIKLVQAERNLGFGPGNNLGASESKGYYLLFLNSDTLVLPHMIDTLISFADSHPEYGAMGPKVLLKDQKTIQPASYGRLPTLTNTLLRTSVSKRPRLDSRFVCTDTEWITGAAMLIPREVFMNVNGFDSQFFMYFEDQDLCAAIYELGFQVCVVNDANIVHLGGQSQVNGAKRLALYDKSQAQFFLKHHGWWKTALLLVLRLPWKLVRTLR